jgi:hypothetical protein
MILGDKKMLNIKRDITFCIRAHLYPMHSMMFSFLCILVMQLFAPCCARFIYIADNYLIPFSFIRSVIYTLSMFGLLLFFDNFMFANIILCLVVLLMT